MKKILGILVAAAMAVCVQAAETSLVAFIAEQTHQTTVQVGTACASGGAEGVQYLGGYPPAKAFDGVGETTDTQGRWLGNMVNGQTFLRFDVPQAVADEHMLTIVSYDVWDSNAYGGDYKRGPTEWTLEGMKSDGTWVEIDHQADVLWRDLPGGANECRSFPVPENKRLDYSAYRFTPLHSNAEGGSWDAGLMELTLNVDAMPRGRASLVVCSDPPEADCFDPKAGVWNDYEVGTTVDCTALGTCVKDGVHYVLKGYAIQSKAPGMGWSAPVTNTSDH